MFTFKSFRPSFGKKTTNPIFSQFARAISLQMVEETKVVFQVFVHSVYM